MNKSRRSKISYSLFIIAFSLTTLGYVTTKMGNTKEWLFNLGAVIAIIGLILYLTGKKNNEIK